ncbi:MAG: AI-2E family transporter [Candidatus Acidiferrum sp.]
MTEANRNITTSDRLTTVLSYGALLLLGYLVFLITEPFLVPLAWSAVLAIFFYPAYLELERRFSPNLSALFCTLAVTFLLIVPVLLVLAYAAREAIVASAGVRETLNANGPGAAQHVIAAMRRHLPDSLQNLDIIGYLRQGVERAATFLASSIGSLVKNLFSFLVNLFILLFALFFMFRDGDGILRVVRQLIPFEPEIQEEMLGESRDLIFASVAVAVLIAAIQGALGGLAFELTGVPGPVFLGVLIAFCSIIPVVGSGLVWLPASVWLAIDGHWGKALVVLAICGGVAGVADNIVRPLLLRNRTRLNDLLLFVSILGGLNAFGLLGLVVGPTILAAGLGVMRVYVDRQEELQRKPA